MTVRIVRASGFTLVELVSTLIIMGILAAVAMPRFFKQQTFDAYSFHHQALSMVRYAQKIAVAQNRAVHVRLDGTSIATCYTSFAADGGCASPVPAPSGRNSGSNATPASRATLAACGNNNWHCEAIPVGVAVQAVPAVETRFYFNALGKPFRSADVPPASTFTNLDISLTNGGIARHIFVEAETGYVHP